MMGFIYWNERDKILNNSLGILNKGSKHFECLETAYKTHMYANQEKIKLLILIVMKLKNQSHHF